MDCSLPGSSVHGIFQARILEWVAIPSPGDLPNPGIEPESPALQADTLPSEPSGKDPMYVLLHSMPLSLQQDTTNPCLQWRLLDTHRQVWSVSCGVTAPFSWALGTRFCLCPPRVYFPVLCKFWQLYSGVSDDLLQEGLCQIQVCCTQSSCPCGRPLLIRTSTGDPAQAKII